MIGAQLPITGEMDAESLALHQNVLETAHNAYVAIGELGTVTTWKRAAERIFGWPKPTAVGHPLVSLIIPERYRAAHTTGLARYLQSGQGSVIGRRLELAALRADGSEFPIEISISATEEGGRFSFHAFIADVTERHAREWETHLLATIVRESADAIIVKDAVGTIIEWNPGAERLYGYSAEEAVGHPISILVPPERSGEEIKLLRRALSGAVITQFETERLRRDGNRVEVSLTISPIHKPRGSRREHG